MKKLPLPNYQFLNIYKICLQDCNSLNLPAMREIIQYLPEHESVYQQRAASTTLYQSTRSRHGYLQDLVIGNVTKADFIDLYDKCFAKPGTKGRKIYDAIRSSSDELCPLCGIGYVSTLDHYLPKARYPLYSVHSHNLVPACVDCNKAKGSSVLNSSVEEPLHPYFIPLHFINDHWIAAEIMETIPTTARFYPNPPTNWNQDCRQRAITHFNDFNLARRYRTQASQYFTMLTDNVKELRHEQNLNTKEIQANFLAKSQNQPPNSIPRALMVAIAESEWFCSEQYLG